MQLHRSPAHQDPLLWMYREEPGIRELQCLVYSHHDSLVIQIVIGKLGEPTDMTVAWAEAVDILHRGSMDTCSRLRGGARSAPAPSSGR